MCSSLSSMSENKQISSSSSSLSHMIIDELFYMDGVDAHLQAAYKTHILGLDAAISDESISNAKDNEGPSVSQSSADLAPTALKDALIDTLPQPLSQEVQAHHHIQEHPKPPSRDLSNIDTLEALSDYMQSLPCGLKNTARHFVFGEGCTDSPDIMIIGEAPGADEDRLGRPFVGKSGQLLDRMLLAIHASRHTDNSNESAELQSQKASDPEKLRCYITNILPWRPPQNRTPSVDEVGMFLDSVHRHIELVKPKKIMLLGGVAAKAMLDTQTGIMRLRGKWHAISSRFDHMDIACIPTFHPSFLLRSPLQKRLAWHDLLMLRDAVG